MVAFMLQFGYVYVAAMVEEIVVSFLNSMSS